MEDISVIKHGALGAGGFPLRGQCFSSILTRAFSFSFDGGGRGCSPVPFSCEKFPTP